MSADCGNQSFEATIEPAVERKDGEHRALPIERRTGSRAESIEQLFRRHHQALRKFLTVRLNSQQEADEVAMEAYVRLLQLDAVQTQAVGFLRSFLYKTAQNLAIDRLRTRQVAARAHSVSRLFGEAACVAAPDGEVAAAEELQIIEQCLRELPPKCRQAFFLNRFHGLSVPSVARHLNVAERTVRFYLVETIRYCRSRLDRLNCPPEYSRSKTQGA